MDGMEAGGMDQGMGESSPQGGYCIEIYVSADGKPQSVNVETMDDESAEGQDPMQGQRGMDQGDMDGEPAPSKDKGVPVGSLEEAMSMVQEIIKSQGQMPEDQGSPEDQMMKGYGKGSISSNRGGLPVRKVFSGGM